ncbi:YmfQ family protein [Alicyclobacillus fastidiosus]|uniref:YmfQ family protein n=1 Tax=Alicyclobacillus fastidiosus TaxID=392011 RepID=A0ABY6ZKV3_9BACL|nr:putative phage tail protein [Alicyclobacillus fastidiosus]WAH43564.1 YmfQ family protein [Alicyclobacillus fastidiosus]GMA59742.1 hypothetical protein GCM10025859_01820 [Alicyclobacillus fastidiosus]
MANYDDFVSWLPPSFFAGTDAVTMNAFLVALGRQFDDLDAAIADNQNQLFIQLATWALSTYEAEFAIKLVDGGTDSERQNNIMAKNRAGQGATPAALLNILSAYGYACQINQDFANYAFTIQFTDFKGIPPNMGDLQTLLTSMTPAHLQTLYSYLYNVFSNVDGQFTYSQLAESGLTYEQLLTQLPTT